MSENPALEISAYYPIPTGVSEHNLYQNRGQNLIVKQGVGTRIWHSTSFYNLANIAIVMLSRVLYILAKLAETKKGCTMRQFSATDLANKTGDVLALAAQQPVAIARHGKRRFVVLSTEEFEALRQGKDSRTEHHVDDLDDAEATRLMTELQASIDND